MTTQKFFPAIISNGKYEINLGWFHNSNAAREDIKAAKKFNNEFNADTFVGKCNKIICVDADYDIAKMGEMDYHKMMVFPA